MSLEFVVCVSVFVCLYVRQGGGGGGVMCVVLSFPFNETVPRRRAWKHLGDKMDDFQLQGERKGIGMEGCREPRYCGSGPLSPKGEGYRIRISKMSLFLPRPN